MAGTISATIGEEVDSLLSTFDHIHEDFKSALMEIQRLKSNSNGEIKKREALELACKSLKQILQESVCILPLNFAKLDSNQYLSKVFPVLEAEIMGWMTMIFNSKAIACSQIHFKRKRFNSQEKILEPCKVVLGLKNLVHKSFRIRVFCHLAENERLVKLYTESLNNVVDQLEHRTTCHSLKEQLKRMNDGCLSKEDERRKIEESVKQEYAKKISDLETQIRGLVLEKATKEATLNQLRQDLGAHKSHIQYLAGRLERVNLNVESKYEIEIRGLRDCITNEQEEKRELNHKLQQLEKECESKIVKQQPNLTSDAHNETLLKTNVEPRKENKTLKRKLVKTERE
ncbi:hypothetical protein CsatB_011684 [Cannabis sativa]